VRLDVRPPHPPPELVHLQAARVAGEGQKEVELREMVVRCVTEQ